jgi:hypothetical protein
VFADHREQVAKQLTLALGQVTRDRVDWSRNRSARTVLVGCLYTDADPPRPLQPRVDRGAVGVG